MIMNTDLDKRLNALREETSELGFDLCRRDNRYDYLKKYAEQMVEFAEVALICLQEFEPGFEAALDYGGTGIFPSCFSWRVMMYSVTPDEQAHFHMDCERIVWSVLDLYPFLAANVTRCIYVQNFLDSGTLRLDFSTVVPPGEIAFALCDVKAHRNSLNRGALHKIANFYRMFGDLEIVESYE